MSLHSAPVNRLRRGARFLALGLLAALLAACDGPSIPIPPTPTPGSMQVDASHNHAHGGDGPTAPLFTRYGGDMAVTVGTDPQPPAPMTPVTISYSLERNGAPVSGDALALTHERLMHLIVVSRDLSYFSHLHPSDMGGGRFSVTETLPAGGTYLLFNEFYTGDGKAQIERDVLATAGAGDAGSDPLLEPSLDVPQEVDGLTPVLTSNARKIRRRTSTSFQLKVTENGKPVTDLEPFLGAAAHVVMVSADTKQFAHSHADVPGGTMAGDLGGTSMVGMEMPPPPSRFGPDLQFAHTFMQPGRYRIWVQTGHRGKTVTFGFNIEVYR